MPAVCLGIGLARRSVFPRGLAGDVTGQQIVAPQQPGAIGHSGPSVQVAAGEYAQPGVRWEDGLGAREGRQSIRVARIAGWEKTMSLFIVLSAVVGWTAITAIYGR